MNGIDEGISAALTLLRWAYRGGPRPTCLAACDAEANGSIHISDAMLILRHGFLGFREPDPPFPECTTSAMPTDLLLGCEVPSRCP